jgi:hypothetical protein
VQTLDASVFKTTKFERVELQLRFESFNVLNHPQFAIPNATANGTTALGTITSTNGKVPNRQNQAGVRISF